MPFALLFGLLALSTLAALVAAGYHALHWIQLEGYRVERYLRHSRENFSARSLVPFAVYFLTLVVAWFLLAITDAAEIDVVGLWGFSLIWVAEAAWIAWSTFTRPSKKPIAFTARLWRQIGVTAVLALLVVAAVAAVPLGFVSPAGLSPATFMLLAYAVLGLLVLCMPLVAVLALVLLEPVEVAIRKSFIAKARRRLAEVNPIVIGISGSYGKTTTKAAVAAALSKRYQVLASPESYNTLLGVTRTINEFLEDDTEVLVVEMGARHPGDVAEICDLVHPRIGVVTRLGPQHLEYFKTTDTIVSTKTELLRSLPANGFAVVDADGLTDFTVRDWPATTVRVAMDSTKSPDILVQDIGAGRQGTSFTLKRSSDGAEVTASTRLLGRHSAANCALAVVVGFELGLDFETIQAGLATLEPVPHRLQMIRNDSVVVIDDAFNSNPEGFSAALEVLGSFDGRRVLITPGMIELGDQTVPAHERVGRLAAQNADVVWLIGRAYPEEFAQAMLAAGLPEQRLQRFDTLAAATEFLGSFIQSGDVVLFENDLPDNYA